LRSYFTTPVAYVFIVIFLFLAGLFTFNISTLFESNQASLRAFFEWLPWLYLFLVPAVGMRLWAEERRSGTIELLLTMPTTIWQAVMAKFLAAWVFLIIALALTFPMVLTVVYLGDPDMGVIFASYAGAVLMAGALLAIGLCMSALTRNQVISFVLAIVIILIFMLAGFDIVQSFFSSWSVQMAEAVGSLSFQNHFRHILLGNIRVADLLFYVSMILGWLYATRLIVEMKKDG
ncbi:MAG: ABC transporter permease, partial [Candidatus Sumerlaeota bacterium]